MRIFQTVKYAGVVMRGPASLPLSRRLLTIENDGNNVGQLGVDTVEGFLGYTPINKSGDTGIGSLSFNNSSTIGWSDTYFARSGTASLELRQNISNYASITLSTIKFNSDNVLQASSGVLEIRNSSNTSPAPFSASRGNLNIQSASDPGLVIRSASGQTADFLQFQNNAGTVLSRITSGGIFSGVGNTGTISTSSGYLGFAPATGLMLQFTAGVDGDFRVYNSVGSNMRYATSTSFDQLIPCSHNRLTIAPQANQVVGIGNWSTEHIATLCIRSNSTSTVSFAVRAIVSQTSNLSEWRDASSNILSYIDISGNMKVPQYYYLGTDVRISRAGTGIGCLEVYNATTGWQVALKAETNISGVKLGLFSQTPSFRSSTYTTSNSSTLRSIDLNTATFGDLANIVCTLIQDLKSLGAIG